MVWLDYTNPLAPKILELEEINDLSTAYDDLSKNSIVIYEKVNFSTDSADCVDFEERLGFSGRPEWVQEQVDPICLKSREKMRFLCQIEDQYPVPIKVKFTNVQTIDEYYQRYFDELNFWGDGDIFVFFNSNSKVACYFIQNT